MLESVEQLSGQAGDTGKMERIRPRCLLIDDHDGIVLGTNLMFGKFDFKAVECHSVEEALDAIEKSSPPPQVLFLDHNLKSGGSEGLIVSKKILEMIKEGALPPMKIYSTTNSEDLIPEYDKLGIKHVDKGDFEGLTSIISGE